MSNITKETLDALKMAQASPTAEIAKAGWTQATGLTFYDLQAPAKLLFPITTPLRNVVPRVMGRGDIATRWKTITALNSGNITPGVSESNRGALLTTAVNNVTATYKSFGLEDSVSFEADYAAEGFDDARARAAQGLLLSMMTEEERVMLGGNASTGLGTPSTPTSSAITLTSTLTNQTYSIIVVALTLDGYRRASIAGGLVNTYTQTSAGAYSNSDTHAGGVSKKSTAKSQAITGTTQSLVMNTVAINGAVAYAWYWGLSGSELLGAITTTATYTTSAEATGTQNATAVSGSTDESTDALVYDGLLGIVATNSSSYYASLTNGSKLTSDGGVGIVEINTALKSMYDNFKTGPTKIWCSSQELLDINALILKATGAPLVRFNADMQSPNRSITAMSVVGNYFNPFTNELISIEVHPNMPQGTIVLASSRLPPQFYQYSNVGSPVEFHYRRDYYQIDWPQIKRSFEMGVYSDGVMACYAPFTFGVINNVTHQ